ncbi:DUF2171 domain-containing protein [Pseudoroseomonas ludipueritiae]|uniref:DUF2171 domain-containing protein n=1 Tax=Pseudoroseomonas ludipueritiae TaxID=198093 RepID=A0ABR7R912_9PROT|nr:DUF2171 domain-containing protein [Pseudoroseomonas ludipueritiae]MBC9178199.1 DUF2171 domain-containing protein [Pseudoroseomonas ludipueritiae]MCG7361736.1 DUF2171 domain-containing protein [Roseomonas sp. ACRSG]
MVDTTLIREHMPVVDCNGQPIGTVDHLDAGRLKLTRDAQGRHHYLPLSEVSMVDEEKITAQLTREEALRLMQSGARDEHTES